MAISFKGSKKYKKHNGFTSSFTCAVPLPSSMHFYSLHQGNLTLSPTISEGERVLCGQKIADMTSFNSIPVISGCSGTVVSADNGVISVENDMLYESLEFSAPYKPYTELTVREMLWLIREGGVWESRENMPVHVLLGKKHIPKQIIVCCFDSDPYVSSPQCVSRKNADKILRGLDIAMRITDTKKAFIAIENDTKRIYADFKYLLRFNESILPYLLKARYPQSNSQNLKKTITGSENSDALILSAETLCNIADVIEHGTPVTKKVVTVSGDDILTPENYIVPIGATISSLLESAGYTHPSIIINGGIIDGSRLIDIDEPVTLSSKAYIAFNDSKNIPKYRKELV